MVRKNRFGGILVKIGGINPEFGGIMLKLAE